MTTNEPTIGEQVAEQLVTSRRHGMCNYWYCDYAGIGLECEDHATNDENLQDIVKNLRRKLAASIDAALAKIEAKK